MQLSVLERLTILGLLPTKGNYTNLKLLRVAKEELSFSDEEHKALNFRQEGTGDKVKTLWNTQQIVNKSTGKPIQGTDEYVMTTVNADPSKYEMRPVVKGKDIIFGEVVIQLIAKSLTDLEKSDSLEDQHFSLYERFVLGSKHKLKTVK